MASRQGGESRARWAVRRTMTAAAPLAVGGRACGSSCRVQIRDSHGASWACVPARGCSLGYSPRRASKTGRAFPVRPSTAVPSLTSDSEKKGPVIMEIPLDKIRRPLMRTRTNDPAKVLELMDSIRVIGLQVPIDVLEVDGVYYGFSGCHRYEAHQRLDLPTIRCKVRRGTKETLRHHMR